MHDIPLFTADRLPRKPYCSNNKIAGRILPQAQALAHSHIQFNPPNLICWLVFDLDFDKQIVPKDTAQYWYEDRLAPVPNIIVINEKNGHAQYYYALATPVARGRKARFAPQLYAQAVYQGLGAKLQADACFTQFMARNPKYHEHLTICPRMEPYELSELDEFIADRRAGSAWYRAARRSGRAVNGKGRNCSLFDRTRAWANEWVAEYRAAGRDRFEQAVLRQAESANQFPGHPAGDLKFSEVRSIARSVSRWVWELHHGNGASAAPADLRELQAARGRMTGARKRDALMQRACALAEQGLSCRAVGRQLGVNDKTVSAWLKRVVRQDAAAQA